MEPCFWLELMSGSLLLEHAARNMNAKRDSASFVDIAEKAGTRRVSPVVVSVAQSLEHNNSVAAIYGSHRDQRC